MQFQGREFDSHNLKSSMLVFRGLYPKMGHKVKLSDILLFYKVDVEYNIPYNRVKLV